MNIDPRAEQFGPIRELTLEAEELFAEMASKGQIIAIASEAEPLRLLQDDLRKRGYRQQFSRII